jgi:hypothetical protein
VKTVSQSLTNHPETLFVQVQRDYDQAMSTGELVEQIKALSARERRRLVEMLLELEDDSTPPPASLQRVQWPDVEARAKRIFGNRIMPNLVLMERGESPF